MPLTDEQIERYSRQIILPEVGGVGQERLLGARVQVGGSGSVAAWASRYLVAAGVGEVVLEPRLAGALRASLEDLNPDCRVEAEAGAPGSEPAPLALLASAGDAAIAAAWSRSVPVVVARLRRAAGELTMLCASHPSSPCPECAGAGRVNGESADDAPSAAPLIAVLAVTEVLKLVLGVGKALYGRRLVCDVKTQAIEESRLVCQPGCPWSAR